MKSSLHIIIIVFERQTQLVMRQKGGSRRKIENELWREMAHLLSIHTPHEQLPHILCQQLMCSHL